VPRETRLCVAGRVCRGNGNDPGLPLPLCRPGAGSGCEWVTEMSSEIRESESTSVSLNLWSRVRYHRRIMTGALSMSVQLSFTPCSTSTLDHPVRIRVPAK
jgi:hypothetical protein